MHSCKYSVSFLLRTVIHLKHRVIEFRVGLSAGGKATGGQNSGPVRVQGAQHPWPLEGLELTSKSFSGSPLLRNSL